MRSISLAAWLHVALWAAVALTAAAQTSTITVTQFPHGGTTGTIAGTVSGLTNPATYKIVLYLQGIQGTWWIKPQPGGSFPLAADGSFTLDDWGTSRFDAGLQAVHLYVVPSTSSVVDVLGGPLPTSLSAIAVVDIQIPADYHPGSPVPSPSAASSVVASPAAAAQPSTAAAPAASPAVSPVASPAAAGPTQVPWPPGPPGDKQPRQGDGSISFAGRRWLVKNSNGGRVGPRNNMFVDSLDNVWTDAWGLHLNVMPTDGCNNWLASEVNLDTPLGYGTYLVRHAGVMEFLDPDITWSPSFMWDNSGNADNGYREVDFEIGRWGNTTDLTNGQFVLKPLQAGGSLPGWRARWETKNLSIWEGSGAGSGGCNEAGQDNFNGAAVSKMTCAWRWFPGTLWWACADGFWTIETFGSIPLENLLASYNYPDPQYVPDPGQNQVHMNMWLQNYGATPSLGRRGHAVIAGFEYQSTDAGFTALPATSKIDWIFPAGMYVPP